jgi:hypothetical protein
MQKLLALAAVTLLVASCAFTPDNKHTKADAESAITAAEHEAMRADKMGGQWRDVADMIKTAKDAIKEDKFDEAVNLANTAKRQATLGIEQATSQKNAGPQFP